MPRRLSFPSSARQAIIVGDDGADALDRGEDFKAAPELGVAFDQSRDLFLRPGDPAYQAAVSKGIEDDSILIHEENQHRIGTARGDRLLGR